MSVNNYSDYRLSVTGPSSNHLNSSTHREKKFCWNLTFLVACTRLCDPLCPSVRLSVGRSVTLSFFRRFWVFFALLPLLLVVLSFGQ